MSEKRNLAAHNVFGPSDDESGVQFAIIKAKGKLEFPKPVWSIQSVLVDGLRMNRYGDELKELQPKLKTHPISSLFNYQMTPTPDTAGLGLLGLLGLPPPENHSSDTTASILEKAPRKTPASED